MNIDRLHSFLEKNGFMFITAHPFDYEEKFQTMPLRLECWHNGEAQLDVSIIVYKNGIHVFQGLKNHGDLENEIKSLLLSNGQPT